MRTLLTLSILWVMSCLTSFAQTQPLPTDLPPSLSAVNPATLINYVQAVKAYKIATESRIAALQGELAALNNVVAQGDTLTAYDEQKRQQLEAELTVCQGKLEEANRVLARCWDVLPRHYRNQGLSLYEAVDLYAADLKRRGRRLLVIGVAIGAVGTFLLLR